MSFITQAQTDVENAVSDLPTNFVFKGSNYTGDKSAIDSGDENEQGGFVTDYDFTMACSTSQFTTETPNTGDTITINSKDYKIVGVRRSEDEQAGVSNVIFLECNSPDG